MANTSIRAAFEQMWQHVIARLNGFATIESLDNATSNIQTQLDSKAGTGHTHSATKITSGILPIERGGTGNGNGYIRAGQLDGATIGALATAEGRNTTASGDYCHAEGNYTDATGTASHAEGQSSVASGTASHAEGDNTEALSYASHAEGHGTIANGEGSHAQGRYNIKDTGAIYAHIVGNGSSASARSNAHTLDWNGVGWFKGGLKVGGTGQDDANAKEVALKSDAETWTFTLTDGSTVTKKVVIA